MKLIPLSVALVGVALFAQSCKKEPTGQVVAVVNGEDVSQNELQAEIQSMGNAQGADPAKVRQVALQRLIDRTLVVQQAREQKLDQDPEYQKRRLRMEDQLLAEMLGRQMANTVKPPSQNQIDQFIAKNPFMFNQRTIFQVEQIRFQQPADMQRLKALEPLHTMGEVRTALDQMGFKSAIGRGQIDSLNVAPELLNQINKLPPREPLVMVSNGNVFINDIIARQVVPMPPAEARRIASNVIREEEFKALADKRLKGARTSAKIDLQPGYTLPPPSADGTVKGGLAGPGAVPNPGSGAVVGNTAAVQ